jgi:hypothetical protein
LLFIVAIKAVDEKSEGNGITMGREKFSEMVAHNATAL